jgi:acyl carrier protein
MDLRTQLKQMIIKELRIMEFTPEDIQDDDILFGPKFGLDSIDAIEVVYQLKRMFGVEIKDMKEGRPILQSINTICAFIEGQRAAA